MTSNDEGKFDEKYDRCFADLLENEGRFSNIVGDHGGRTWMGVAETFHPEVFRRLDQCKTDEARRTIAKEFYYDSYWIPMRCYAFPDRIAFELFDTAVLCGVSRATCILQRTLNLAIRAKCMSCQTLVEDGKFGSLTAKVAVDIAKRYERNMLGWLNGYQAIFLLGLEISDQIKWGWGRRLSEKE